MLRLRCPTPQVQSEIELLHTLQHERIVRCYETVRTSDHLYIVLGPAEWWTTARTAAPRHAAWLLSGSSERLRVRIHTPLSGVQPGPLISHRRRHAARRTVMHGGLKMGAPLPPRQVLELMGNGSAACCKRRLGSATARHTCLLGRAAGRACSPRLG